MRHLNKKYIILLIVLILVSLILPYLMVHTSYLIAPFLVLGICAIFFIGLTMVKYQYGIYLTFLYGCIFSLLSRLFTVDLPYGVLYDLLILLTFISMIIKVKSTEGFQWKTSEPIVVLLFVYYGYFILQIANPNAVSILAWLDSARSFTLLLLLYIFIHLFNNKESIQRFTNFWLITGFFIALYGLYQEYIGFLPFEYAWLTSNPIRFELYHIWGHIRTFSTLSDPSNYGLFLAFCGTGSLVLSIGPGSISKKLVYITGALIMFLSMSYSGTRTAFAMIVVGVAFFILANLRNVKILAASSIIVFIFIILMVGPFYSGPINRMRSTFDLSSDPSMNVRDSKRIRLQNYVKSHPIGGGVNTAGNEGMKFSASHPLAGFYSPDSGYLRTALEMGWLGLLIILTINTAVAIQGIKNYFNIRDPQLKIYSMVYTVSFLGISVAHYTQDALYQKPMNILVMASFAMIIQAKVIDKDERAKD